MEKPHCVHNHLMVAHEIMIRTSLRVIVDIMMRQGGSWSPVARFNVHQQNPDVHVENRPTAGVRSPPPQAWLLVVACCSRILSKTGRRSRDDVVLVEELCGTL